MFLTATGLHKQFRTARGKTPSPGLEALHDVSFQVQHGEIVSFIGPSGAGKTTLLKCIAGLESACKGHIEYATPPSKKHPIILVFQDFLLFPHLTIFENVAFGLKARRLPKAEVRERTLAMLGYFGIEEKRAMFPAHLSAGQKQRVAIARAMVVEPALLLLDEPFANLDRNLKMQTAEFIRATQKRFGVTTISVTHDLEEAFAMSDRLGLMLDGKLVQYGTAEELYHAPSCADAATFLGPINKIPSTLALQLGLPAQQGTLLYRPESIRLAKQADGPGVVDDAVFAGHYWKFHITAFGHGLSVYSHANGIKPGDRVAISVAARSETTEPTS